VVSLQLAAHPIDVDVNHVGKSVFGFLPDFAPEHVSGDDHIQVAHQVGEHVEFALRQGDVDARTARAPLKQIQLEVVHAQHRLGAFSAQHHAEAGKELRECEGLHQVVVRADVETGHAILHGVACGQDKDGDCLAGAAQVGQD